jgi:hypothetical protein
MTAGKPGFVRTVSILTRRLRKGKTYEDFRKAWFHTTGFGVKGENVEGGSTRLLTFINIFDPEEIIVLGFAKTTLEGMKAALDIDVRVRGENPLDEVIEPEIGRAFALQLADDDFSAIGDIPYCPPMIDGKVTDLGELEKTRQDLLAIFAAAAAQRDAVNEARHKVQ